MSESDIDICIEQVQIELEQDMPVRKRQVRMLLSELSRLRAEVESLKRGAIREVIDTLTDGPVVTKGLQNIAGVAWVFKFPHEFSEAIVKASNELDAARSEIARLRNLIEDAPHDTYCSEFGPCDCWKRAALEGK